MHGNLPDNDLELETLSDLLRRRAAQFPARPAFVFEDESGARVEWTYAQLDQRARAIAVWLESRAEIGDRALLVYPAGLEFIAAFFGCLYAGVLPVPATHPKPRRPLPRLDTIANDCSPRLALTHSSVLGGLRLDQQSPTVAKLAWEATDRIATAEASEGAAGENREISTAGKLAESQPADGWQTVERKGEDLAFLQYTSGFDLPAAGGNDQPRQLAA